MKFLVLLLIGLGIGLGVYYVMLSGNEGMQVKTQEAANTARDSADAYQKNQQEMMKQLGQ